MENNLKKKQYFLNPQKPASQDLNGTRARSQLIPAHPRPNAFIDFKRLNR